MALITCLSPTKSVPGSTQQQQQQQQVVAVAAHMEDSDSGCECSIEELDGKLRGCQQQCQLGALPRLKNPDKFPTFFPTQERQPLSMWPKQLHYNYILYLQLYTVLLHAVATWNSYLRKPHTILACNQVRIGNY